jgi:glycosyltransferase involved in cell wall biosynthesis
MGEREKIILFSGSLDSIFNEVGLLEFLNICWSKIQDCGYTLLVSGRNPSKKIILELGRYRNADIIANPPDMEKIIKNARLLVLPDLYGTGMKLRVAEALSYGVPVVGTVLGLRGYDNVESFGVAVESIHDMNEAVLTLIESTERLKKLSLSAIELWEDRYTFKIFRSRIHSILDSL